MIELRLFTDRCYRPDEVAQILHVHVRTVYRHINDLDDPLPALRLSPGGPLRIPGLAANIWLATHRVNPLES